MLNPLTGRRVQQYKNNKHLTAFQLICDSRREKYVRSAGEYLGNWSLVGVDSAGTLWPECNKARQQRQVSLPLLERVPSVPRAEKPWRMKRGEAIKSRCCYFIFINLVQFFFVLPAFFNKISWKDDWNILTSQGWMSRVQPIGTHSKWAESSSMYLYKENNKGEKIKKSVLAKLVLAQVLNHWRKEKRRNNRAWHIHIKIHSLFPRLPLPSRICFDLKRVYDHQRQ